jgi:hypothetical protein
VNKTGYVLQPGTKLWYVPSDPRNEKYAHEVIITKVGRKWAYFGPHSQDRLDPETLRVDGGIYCSPGTCYESKETYEALCLANRFWRHLKDKMGWDAKVDAEKVREAAKMLGIDLE